MWSVLKFFQKLSQTDMKLCKENGKQILKRVEKVLKYVKFTERYVN